MVGYVHRRQRRINLSRVPYPPPETPHVRPPARAAFQVRPESVRKVGLGRRLVVTAQVAVAVVETVNQIIRAGLTVLISGSVLFLLVKCATG